MQVIRMSISKRYVITAVVFVTIVVLCFWARFEAELSQRSTANLLQYGLDYKQILLLTAPTQHSSVWPYREGAGDFHDHVCEVSKCFFTRDQQLLQSSDAVMVYSTDVLSSDDVDDLLQERLPQQIWVYVDHQPPRQGENLEQFDGLFNMAMSYKSGSDIVTPLGASKVLSQSERSRHNADLNAMLEGRSKSILWYVTDCELLDNQDLILLWSRVTDQVPIEIVSNCPPDPQCVSEPTLERCRPPKPNTRDYRFQLVIESQACDSYISQQFWDVLREGTIPIVLGASLNDYSAAAPPHSFIHVQNFTSVEYLIDHLTHLLTDNDAYLRYYKWRNGQRIASRSELTIDNAYAVCQLCAMVHDESTLSNSYIMSKWWSAEENCDANIVPFPLPA